MSATPSVTPLTDAQQFWFVTAISAGCTIVAPLLTDISLVGGFVLGGVFRAVQVLCLRYLIYNFLNNNAAGESTSQKVMCILAATAAAVAITILGGYLAGYSIGGTLLVDACSLIGGFVIGPKALNDVNNPEAIRNEPAEGVRARVRDLRYAFATGFRGSIDRLGSSIDRLVGTAQPAAQQPAATPERL